MIEKERSAENAWNEAEVTKQQAYEMILEHSFLKSHIGIEIISARALKIDRMSRIADIKARCEDATLDNWQEAIHKTKEAKNAWEEFINSFQALKITNFPAEQQLEWNENLAKACYWKITYQIQPFWLEAEKAKKTLDATKSKQEALNWSNACMELVKAYDVNDRKTLASAQQAEWDNNLKKAQQLKLESTAECSRFFNVQQIEKDNAKILFNFPLATINEEDEFVKIDEALALLSDFEGSTTTAGSHSNSVNSKKKIDHINEAAKQNS